MEIDFIIDCQVYPYEIWCFFGTKETMFKKLETVKNKKDLKRFKKLVGKHDSGGGFYFNNRNKTSIIHLFKRPENIYELSILNHEILHGVLKILKTIGMEHCWESEEAYTYLFDYLCSKIYEKLDIKISYSDNKV